MKMLVTGAAFDKRQRMQQPLLTLFHLEARIADMFYSSRESPWDLVTMLSLRMRSSFMVRRKFWRYLIQIWRGCCEPRATSSHPQPHTPIPKIVAIFLGLKGFPWDSQNSGSLLKKVYSTWKSRIPGPNYLYSRDTSECTLWGTNQHHRMVVFWTLRGHSKAFQFCTFSLFEEQFGSFRMFLDFSYVHP